MKWITEAKSCWVLLHISSFPGYTGKFSRPWENLPRRGTWPLPLSGVTYYCSDEDQPLWLSLVSLVLRAQNLQTVWLPVTITLTTDIVFLGGGSQRHSREGGGWGRWGTPGWRFFTSLFHAPIHSAFVSFEVIPYHSNRRSCIRGCAGLYWTSSKHFLYY